MTSGRNSGLHAVLVCPCLSVLRVPRPKPHAAQVPMPSLELPSRPLQGAIGAAAREPEPPRGVPARPAQGSVAEGRHLPPAERTDAPGVGTRWEQIASARVLSCPLLSPLELAALQAIPGGNRPADQLDAFPPKE
jgi:hypothetical protein